MSTTLVLLCKQTLRWPVKNGFGSWQLRVSVKRDNFNVDISSRCPRRRWNVIRCQKVAFCCVSIAYDTQNIQHSSVLARWLKAILWRMGRSVGVAVCHFCCEPTKYFYKLFILLLRLLYISLITLLQLVRGVLHRCCVINACKLQLFTLYCIDALILTLRIKVDSCHIWCMHWVE